MKHPIIIVNGQENEFKEEVVKVIKEELSLHDFSLDYKNMLGENPQEIDIKASLNFFEARTCLNTISDDGVIMNGGLIDLKEDLISKGKITHSIEQKIQTLDEEMGIDKRMLNVVLLYEKDEYFENGNTSESYEKALKGISTLTLAFDLRNLKVSYSGGDNEDEKTMSILIWYLNELIRNSLDTNVLVRKIIECISVTYNLRSKV